MVKTVGVDLAVAQLEVRSPRTRSPPLVALPMVTGNGNMSFHLALDHLEWLQASPYATDDHSPLSPATSGNMASKAAVVATFE